jgi:hypothetical protein
MDCAAERGVNYQYSQRNPDGYRERKTQNQTPKVWHNIFCTAPAGLGLWFTYLSGGSHHRLCYAVLSGLIKQWVTA